MSKVTVLGAGAWGTTMAQVLADCGNDVLLWGRSPELVKEINTSHTNKKYLGEHVLPNQLKATDQISEAFSHSSKIVLAIPAQSLRSALVEWKPLFAPNVLIISTIKGIELTTELRMTEVISEVLCDYHRSEFG
jgi:glycerol-3-phosphate dehydrogenase (NAD(P)+)